MIKNNKVYTRELFSDIDKKVFPGKDIFLTAEMPQTEYGVPICSQCGQNVYLLLPERPAEATITLENGGFRICIEDEIECGSIKLFGFNDDSSEPQPVALFDYYGDYFDNGHEIHCLNCGYEIIWSGLNEHDGCPGCNICGRKTNPKAARMYCVHKIVEGCCDPKRDGCLGCIGNYARIKHGIKLNELYDIVARLEDE